MDGKGDKENDLYLKIKGTNISIQKLRQNITKIIQIYTSEMADIFQVIFAEKVL